jgi:DNA-binding Xre family transcriptional regulator
MFSYAPLFKTLSERNLLINALRSDGILHPATIAKINRNESVSLETIADICVYLGVPIQRVVEIKLA